MQACRIIVHDLACRRGDRLLFRGVSLTLGPGDALLVSGANGVGKSSLLRMIAGLLDPVAGTVEREGALGLIDERAALDPHLPLGVALDFWRWLDGDAPEPVTDLEVDTLLDVPVRFLSTGQRKRAAFARLAGQGVPIWLLDEPLNGLDTSAVGQLEALVADHCRAGGICIAASHQPIALPAPQQLILTNHMP